MAPVPETLEWDYERSPHDVSSAEVRYRIRLTRLRYGLASGPALRWRIGRGLPGGSWPGVVAGCRRTRIEARWAQL